jgi:hypothetical protein
MTETTTTEIEAEFIKRIFRGKEAMPTEDLVLAILSQPEVAFGIRVYPLFRNGGIRRQVMDTDLDQNRHDVLRAERLLLELAVQCHNTLSMPPETTELLGRITNALGEMRHNRKPTLFDMPEAPSRNEWPLPPAAVAGTQSEGRLAAALEILVRGGMKLAAAQKWLESEIRSAKLVDAAGNQIRASRVAEWRKNFKQNKKGSSDARRWFSSELEDRKALLTAPRDERKLAACQHYARALIYALAALFSRTIHPPQRGRPSKSKNPRAV